MKKTFLTLALFAGLSMSAQEIKSNKKSSFNLSDVEFTAEVIIPTAIVKPAKVSIDGAKAMRFSKKSSKDGREFNAKSKSAWIMVFKRNGFELVYDDTQTVMYKGKSNGSVTTLIFEKQ